MAWVLGEPTVQQYFDSSGNPLSGGSIEFYVTGTSTPTPVASDSAGATTATSYTLNTNGAPQTSGGTAIALFFDDAVAYKIIRKDSSGGAIAPTIDPYRPPIVGNSITITNAPLVFDTVAAMVAATTLSVGDTVEFLEYTSDEISSGNSGKVVAAGTGTADGGQYIDLASYQFKGMFRKGVVLAKMFGAPGDGVTSAKSATQNCVNYLQGLSNGGTLVFKDGNFLIDSQVGIGTPDNFNVICENATLTIGGTAGDSGFVIGSSATDSAANHYNFTWKGGVFQNSNASDGINKTFIKLQGVADYVIDNVEMNGASNGGIEVLSGSHNGVINRVRIKSFSNSAQLRGIWLNGSDATDYASNLVDSSSITRNATALPVGGVRGTTITKCEFPSHYNIYLENAPYTTIDDNELNAGTVGLRCVTVNTYSHHTKVNNNRITSSASVGNKGVLFTQYSHSCEFKNNKLTGNFGNSVCLDISFLAEVDVAHNDFRVGNAICILTEMGSHGRVYDNDFRNETETSKISGGRCMRIYSIGLTYASTSGYGDTATQLKGWEFTNNRIKSRNYGVQISQQSSLDTSNEPGNEGILVYDNKFYDWDAIGNVEEYPLFIDSIASPANVIYYDVDNNTTVPYNSGFEERNRAEDANGGAVQLQHQGRRGEGTWGPKHYDSSVTDKSQTTSASNGHWIRNGNECHISGRIVVSSLGSLTTTQRVVIGDLPYTAKNQTGIYGSINISFADNINLTSSNISLTAHVVPNTKTIEIYQWGATGGPTSFLISELTASGELIFSGSYPIESLAQ